MSSYNQGYSQSAALLSGLRGGQQHQQHGTRSTSNPAGMGNQSFDELQYMMLQQQMQFQQQPLPFQQRQHHHQQQPQFHNSAQAQLFALQQSQMELQLQQIKMANLALQEQLLMQQQRQQQVRTHLPPQQNQHQQHAASSYGNLAALGQAAANRRAGGRSVSAGPALSYVGNSKAQEDANNSWRFNGSHSYSSPDTSYEAQPELGATARHEVRRGALQNLQQARQQRSPSPAASASSGTFSPPIANLDWQAQRMQYKSGTSSTPEAAVVVTPPAQIDSGSGDYIRSNGAAHPLQQHRKNSSEVSDASIQSLSISEAESHVSPNRGPALVLSKPGDEFPDEEGDDSTDVGPMSPSLSASMRTASIHGTLAAAGISAASPPANEGSEKRRSSSGRHTVILSSSIVDLRRAAAGQNGRNSPFTDSDSSSTASSPTSDKSEVASFESTNSTTATSLPNTSPTSISFEGKEISEADGSLGLGRPPVATNATLPARRAVSAAPAASLNPSASVFAPGPSSTKSYPSSLSASSANSGTTTPMRLFSAPARNGTPTNVATIIRQPKGPADEKDLPAKNFAGMIRRKAVGALRLAAANGTRASPASSPVLGGFPSNVQAVEGGLSRFTSNPTSPLANQTGFNMSDLATRAMRRRSAQGGYTAFVENPGLGMLQ